MIWNAFLGSKDRNIIIYKSSVITFSYWKLDLQCCFLMLKISTKTYHPLLKLKKKKKNTRKCLSSSRNHLLHKIDMNLGRKVKSLTYTHPVNTHKTSQNFFYSLTSVPWLFPRCSHMSPDTCLSIALWQVNGCGRLDYDLKLGIPWEENTTFKYNVLLYDWFSLKKKNLSKHDMSDSVSFHQHITIRFDGERIHFNYLFLIWLQTWHMALH